MTEDNGYTGNTKTYTYDSGGNITKVVTTGSTNSTVTYGYDSVWKDKLVKYGDYEIETDAIGNPLTYRDGMSFTWQGRQMATANVGETAIEYKYNSDGLRTYKKVGTAEYEYEYLGDKLVYQKLGDTRLYFRYDVKGHLASVTRMKDDGSRWTVYAVCNTRGDVEELLSYSGDLYARYYYDAWGNVIKVTNKSGAELTSASEFALQNPIRYRGYQYDSETGLYYLNSRYYDPVTHRFVNADDFSLITANNSAITDKNLFAYCDNNPVMREDTGGDFWETAFDVISLGASVVDVAKNPKDIWAWAGFAGDFFDVVAPCIGGVGEAVRIAKASMKGADAVVDAVSTANKVDNAVDAAKVATSVGEPKKIANAITGYTKHGLSQAVGRNGVGVKPSAILDAVQNPVNVVTKTDDLGRISTQYRGVQSTVVLNEAGKVVSCWAKSSKYWRI